MNCKLVVCDEFYPGANVQLYWFVHFATRGPRVVKKWKNQRIIQISSLLFIIHLHYELQTCNGS